MGRQIYLEQVFNRIQQAEPGTLFVASDFADIASQEVVKNILSRLNKAQQIRRVIRGVYVKPVYEAGCYIPPTCDKVARTLARHYGWTIVPYGQTALWMFGMTQQEPEVWEYVSNGPYKEYKLEKTIRFKKTANRDVSAMSQKTALVIQVLKALGREQVDEPIRQVIRDKLTLGQRAALLAEARHTTAWIYELIRQICY